MQCLTAGQCALRVMVDLATHADRGPVSCKDIAGRQRLSEGYLDHLLPQLEQAGLVRGLEDAEGGYLLARDAAEISVRDVRLAAEEMRDPVFCTLGRHPSGCRFGCPTDWLSEQARQSASAIGECFTLADLCADGPRDPDTESRPSLPGKSFEGYYSAFDHLEAAYAFQQSIVDGVAEPIMVIGMDYQIKLMNRAAREFSSTDVDVSEPALCYQLSHRRETPCSGRDHPCPLRRVRELGGPVTVVHEHYLASGERRLVELNASPLWGADGECHGIIESARDITERTRAEEALQRYARRLRALAERLADAAESEREHLARELHDQVGQNLTALGINLNIVKTHLPPGVRPAVNSRLEDSLSLVQQTAERIRDVMADLRPPVLDDYGLLSALHWYAEQFAGRTDIAVAVENNEPIPRLGRRVETALFRIAQEAMTNVAKHAQASHVTVTLDVDGKTLRLIVADDGVGFDAVQLAEPGRGRGWGLLTMTERAEAVGGRCYIESVPGLGTQIVVEVT